MRTPGTRALWGHVGAPVGGGRRGVGGPVGVPTNRARGGRAGDGAVGGGPVGAPADQKGLGNPGKGEGGPAGGLGEAGPVGEAGLLGPVCGAIVETRAAGPMWSGQGRRPIGVGSEAEKSSRNSRSVATALLVISAKGKTDSSNTTCREVITLLVARSKHRYPLCWRDSLGTHTGWIVGLICGERWRIG